MTRFVVLVLILCFGLAAGWWFRGLKAGEQIADIKKEYAEAAQEGDKVAKRQADELVALGKEKERQAVKLAALEARAAKVRTVEVIKYVSSPGSGSCVFPGDGVRLHDAAALGSLSQDTGAAGKPDGPARTITDRELIPVIVDNYGECNAWRAQLLGLQDWLRGVAGAP